MRSWLLFLTFALALSCAPVKEYYGEFVDEYSGDPISASDCTRHLGECLDTRMEGLPGRVSGQSRCGWCHELCRGDGRWPSRTQTGAECRYWR